MTFINKDIILLTRRNDKVALTRNETIEEIIEKSVGNKFDKGSKYQRQTHC